MCCCGCALAILMEESRLASATGDCIQHNEACETVKSVSRPKIGAMRAIARWFKGARPLGVQASDAAAERSAIA